MSYAQMAYIAGSYKVAALCIKWVEKECGDKAKKLKQKCALFFQTQKCWEEINGQMIPENHMTGVFKPHAKYLFQI